jgi:hypothetical protein
MCAGRKFPTVGTLPRTDWLDEVAVQFVDIHLTHRVPAMSKGVT